VLLSFAFLTTAALAQSNPPSTPQATQSESSQNEQERVFGVIPQFSVTNQANLIPLNSGQKFHLFLRGAFDPFTFFSSGFQAGLSQATDEFAGYGQGAAGYGKRYAATFADQVSSGFFANYFYSTLFREDP